MGLLAETAPDAFRGPEDSQGRLRRASQAACLTSSVTATSRRGGARVMKTDEATLFSGFEAMVAPAGAEQGSRFCRTQSVLLLATEAKSPSSHSTGAANPTVPVSQPRTQSSQRGGK
jgi:hypothetical protein